MNILINIINDSKLNKEKYKQEELSIEYAPNLEKIEEFSEIEEKSNIIVIEYF